MRRGFGPRPGREPVAVGDGRLVSSVAIDEERAQHIPAGFELYASGNYSLERLAREMSDRGLTVRATRRHPGANQVSVSKWHSMLADPYCMGLVRYKGELFPGRHEAITTAEWLDPQGAR